MTAALLERDANDPERNPFGYRPEELACGPCAYSLWCVPFLDYADKLQEFKDDVIVSQYTPGQAVRYTHQLGCIWAGNMRVWFQSDKLEREMAEPEYKPPSAERKLVWESLWNNNPLINYLCHHESEVVYGVIHESRLRLTAVIDSFQVVEHDVAQGKTATQNLSWVNELYRGEYKLSRMKLLAEAFGDVVIKVAKPREGIATFMRFKDSEVTWGPK